MDVNISYSYDKKMNHSAALYWLYCFPKSSVISIKYFIKVEKYNHILIKILFSDMDVNVQDGPGPSSPLLKREMKTSKPDANGTLFRTTGLQCFLTVNIDKRVYNSGNLTLFQYYQKMTGSFLNYSLIRNETVSITTRGSDSSSIQSSKTFLLLMLITSKIEKVNMSIDTLKYQGKESPLCKYAGVTSYDVEHDTKTEISTVCHSSQRYRLRNIYSNTPKLLIVIYQCNEYGILTIDLTATSTKCNVIQFNPCVLGKINVGFPCLGGSIEHCSYLKQLPNFQANCVNGSDCQKGADPHVHVTVPDGACVVLQINHNMDDLVQYILDQKWNYLRIHSLDTCELLNLRHALIVESGKTIYWHVTGFLSG